MMENKLTDSEKMNLYFRTRNPELREEIIVNHVPLVHFVLGRLGISPSGLVEYDDLASQGLIGLIDAVDHFDPVHGTKLSTYATLKIRGKILDYLREMDWLPRTARQRVRAMQQAISVLESTHHRIPTDEELATYMNLDQDTLQKTIMDSSRIVVSLDETIDSSDGGESNRMDWLTDEKQIDPSNLYEDKDQNQKLVEYIKMLPEREQLVLSLYYYEELTFKEIGELLEITESRVCQIHGRAVSSIKSLMKSRTEKNQNSDKNPFQRR